MSIQLKEISKENYIEAVKLKVSADQDKFVAPNVFSIAQSKFYTSWKPTAIYNDEKMVGFLMYGEDDVRKGDSSLWIIRLMIDEKFQGNDYGKSAMAALIKFFNDKYKQEEVFVSFVPDNLVARRLYESLGFTDTGKIEEGEIVYKLKLKE